MVIGFCFNVKRAKYSNDPAKQDDIEFDTLKVIAQIAKTIESLGHRVIKIEANNQAFAKLKKLKSSLDLVFNIAEGLAGDARESQIPLFCEMLGIPYTHSTPTVCAITLNKTYSKLVVAGAGVCKVPGSQIFTNVHQELDSKLSFPLLIKPNSEGSSKGILDKSVVNNRQELKKQLSEMLSKLKVEMLVEEYIDGREFTVAMIDDQGPKVLPIIEQRFDFMPEKMHKIAGYELKWFLEDSLKKLTDAYDCPAKITSKLAEEIRQTSLGIWKAFGLRDCARIDYRLDAKNRLYFIEVNALPGINPATDEISYFPIAVRSAGYTYQTMIKAIITSAAKRYR